jgi:hypothetical protein
MPMALAFTFSSKKVVRGHGYFGSCWRASLKDASVAAAAAGNEVEDVARSDSLVYAHILLIYDELVSRHSARMGETKHLARDS